MIAFNWFEAGATVRKQGNTDLDSLIDLEEARCVANCDNATITDLATNQQTLNSYGSRVHLGGLQGLGPMQEAATVVRSLVFGR